MKMRKAEMKIGDLVRLSSRGRKLSTNVKIVSQVTHGIVINKYSPNIVMVRWFQEDGAVYLEEPRYFYRYELIKFKAKMNKS
jgi:hypothetical protein